MPWEQLYDHPTDHFVELLSMLVTLSDHAHQHPIPAQQILEDLTREKESKPFQLAVVRAHNFLGISCFGGVPLQAIAGGCLFYETRLEGLDIQFPHQLGISVPYWNILCRFNALPKGVRQSQEEDKHFPWRSGEHQRHWRYSRRQSTARRSA